MSDMKDRFNAARDAGLIATVGEPNPAMPSRLDTRATPRTEALMAMEFDYGRRIGTVTENIVIEFCRQLERESTEATALLVRFLERHGTYRAYDHDLDEKTRAFLKDQRGDINVR